MSIESKGFSFYERGLKFYCKGTGQESSCSGHLAALPSIFPCFIALLSHKTMSKENQAFPRGLKKRIQLFPKKKRRVAVLVSWSVEDMFSIIRTHI